MEEWIAWEDEEVRRAWEEEDIREQERERVREERKRKENDPESVEGKRRLQAETARALVVRALQGCREVLRTVLPRKKEVLSDAKGDQDEKENGQVGTEAPHLSRAEAAKALAMAPVRGVSAALRWVLPFRHPRTADSPPLAGLENLHLTEL